MNEKKQIRTVIAKLTDDCNLNCKMCGQSKRREGRASKNFLDFNEVKIFLKDMPKIPEETIAVLWGGEPLLHPRLEDFVRFFKEKEFDISIVSNGYYLDKYIDFFLDIELNYLTISIDGTEQIHDLIRGKKGVYKTVVSSIKQYVKGAKEKNKIAPISVNFTILSDNYHLMEEFALEAEAFGVDCVIFNLPIIVDKKLGNLLCNKIEKTLGRKFTSWQDFVIEDIGIDCNELERIYNRLMLRFADKPDFIRWSHNNFKYNSKNFYRYLYQPNKFIINNYELHNCTRMRESLCIDADGSIVLCPDYKETIVGNIRNNHYTDFENPNVFKRLFSDTKIFPTCLRCSHRYRDPYDNCYEISDSKRIEVRR